MSTIEAVRVAVDVATAIERERYAKIAEEEAPCWKCDCGHDHTKDAITRIRSGQ